MSRHLFFPIHYYFIYVFIFQIIIHYTSSLSSLQTLSYTSCPPQLSFKFMVPFSHWLLWNEFMHILYIPKCNLFGPCNVTCMYVVRADYLAPGKQLVWYSLGKTTSLVSSFPWLPLILSVVLSPPGLSSIHFGVPIGVSLIQFVLVQPCSWDFMGLDSLCRQIDSVDNGAEFNPGTQLLEGKHRLWTLTVDCTLHLIYTKRSNGVCVCLK